MICHSAIGSGIYDMNKFEVFWKYYFSTQKQIVKNSCASRIASKSLWQNILVINKCTADDVK